MGCAEGHFTDIAKSFSFSFPHGFSCVGSSRDSKKLHAFFFALLSCSLSGAWLANTAELVGPCSSLHIRSPSPPVPKPSTIPLALWPKEQQLYTAGSESFAFPEMFYSWFPSLPKPFSLDTSLCSVQGRCPCSPGSHRLCPTSALGILVLHSSSVILEVLLLRCFLASNKGILS